jgi:nitrite reductase/ring-hydroxylating ferredoxin subunit
MTGSPDGWTGVLTLAELPEWKAVKAAAGATDIFLFRTPERIVALANACTHAGGPLHRGRVTATGSLQTVTCPIHGSMFRLADGRVLRGPATRPQPVFEARVNGDIVEVRPSP